MVDSVAALTTCPSWFGADGPVNQELSLPKLGGANGYALWYYGVRKLEFSVAARQVRVKFVVTDVLYPVLSVAKLTEQGLKVEFGHQACLIDMNSRSDAVSVELRRRSRRRTAESSTVSLVTLSETVESPKGLLAVADVAKPVQAADI